MAKRKSDSSSDNDEVRSTNKSNNSINQSYIQTATLMSKTKLFDRGLNQSTSAVIPNIKVEHISESSESEKVSPKSKKKSKIKNNRKDSNPVGDNERESTIALLLNETKEKVLKDKSKKSPKRKSQDKQNETLSTNVLDNIKSEISDYTNSNEAQNVDSDQEHVNGNEISYMNWEEEDEKIMTSVEKKIHLIQDIRIIPGKVQTPQEQLNESHPNLRKIDVHTKMKIKDSVNVYLLHVPKSVNPENLINKEIHLEENCRVNIDGENYTIKPTSNVPDPTVVLNNKTEILHFKKNLVLEKYIKANKEPTIPSMEKILVPLPSNLKNRHPLFGSNYEDRIQLDEAIEEKLDDALKNLLKPSKSKKIKKIDKAVGHSTLLPDVTVTNDFSFNLSSISSERKSKKKKRENVAQANDDYCFIADLFKTEDDKKQKIGEQTSKESRSSEAHNKELNGEIKIKKRKREQESTDFSPKKKKK